MPSRSKPKRSMTRSRGVKLGDSAEGMLAAFWGKDWKSKTRAERDEFRKLHAHVQSINKQLNVAYWENELKNIWKLKEEKELRKAADAFVNKWQGADNGLVYVFKQYQQTINAHYEECMRYHYDGSGKIKKTAATITNLAGTGLMYAAPFYTTAGSRLKALAASYALTGSHGLFSGEVACPKVEDDELLKNLHTEIQHSILTLAAQHTKKGMSSNDERKVDMLVELYKRVNSPAKIYEDWKHVVVAAISRTDHEKELQKIQKQIEARTSDMK